MVDSGLLSADCTALRSIKGTGNFCMLNFYQQQTRKSPVERVKVVTQLGSYYYWTDDRLVRLKWPFAIRQLDLDAQTLELQVGR